MSRRGLRIALAAGLLALGPGAGARAQPDQWPIPPPLAVHRGRIGVHVQAMTPELREHLGAPEQRGLLVTRVEEKRPAARAGVRVGDVLLSAGGKSLAEPYDLVRVVGLAPEGEPLELELVRDGEAQTLVVEPEGEPTPWVDPEHWLRGFERGMQRGSEELRRQLRELERRLEELERRLEGGELERT